MLTLGEIRRGVERLRSRDPVTAGALDRWLARIEREFASRVVAVDAGVADTWGRLDARSLPVIDGLLAATALTHDLVLVTRNVRDVKGTGVRVLDPFGAA